MRLRLPVTLVLVSIVGSAASATATGSRPGESAPPPPPPPPAAGSAHGGGGSAHGGGSANGGGSARGGGSTRGSGPVQNGVSTRVQGSGYAGYAPSSAASLRGAKVATQVPKTYRWLCEGPRRGMFYYSSVGACPDLFESLPAPSAAATPPAAERGPARPYETTVEYATDPGAVGVGPSAGKPRTAGIPVETRTSETVAPYSVFLRDGTALASMEQPRQAGNRIVARDRTGKLYSIRVAEVDLAATRPGTAGAPVH
jgi:hypothetical protein